jgi:hypothetical protein
MRYLRDAQTRCIRRQLLPVLVFAECSVLWVQLKVYELRGTEGDYDLSLVSGRTKDGTTRRAHPLVDSLVWQDMTDTVRVNLEETRFAKLLHGNGGSRRKESSIVDLLDSFPDRKNESAVDE